MLKAHLKFVAQLAAYSLSASLCIGGDLGDNGRLIYSRTLTHDGFDPAAKWPAVGDFSTNKVLVRRPHSRIHQSRDPRRFLQSSRANGIDTGCR